MKNKVLVRITTVPSSLDILLKGQLKYLNNYFKIIAISSPGPELENVKIREGVEIKPILMKREISLLHDISSLIILWLYFYKKKPDIIHSNTPKASLLSMIAGFLSGVNHRIYNVTGLRFESESGFKKLILISIEKITCYFATEIVAESFGVKKILQKNNITNKKINIIGNGNINGIDLKYWNRKSYDQQILRNKFNFSNNTFIFIFIGRITKDKGVDELVDSFIEIFNDNSDVVLLILGEIDDNKIYTTSFFNKINEFKNIFYLGFKNDIREFLQISNCLILPSYREGFPNVILQAGAFGKPVIMTDVCGSDEYLYSFNGIKIKKKSKSDLIDAMKSMIKNHKYYDQDAIYTHISRNFSQEILYSELIKFYQNL